MMTSLRARIRTVGLAVALVAVAALFIVGRQGLALFVALPLLIACVAPRVTAIDDANRDAGQLSEDGPAVAPDAGGMLGG